MIPYSNGFLYDIIDTVIITLLICNFYFTVKGYIDSNNKINNLKNTITYMRKHMK